MTVSSENLPDDLLLYIAERLDVVSSIQLSAVCTSWASAIAIPSFPSFRPDNPVPWLLLSAEDNSQTSTNLTFYDLTTATSYSVPISIPLLSGHRWLGSNKGWLVTIDPHFKFHLIKPLTGTQILLPSDGIEDYCKKVLLCRTPDHAHGFLAVAINKKGRLFLAKTGAKSWTAMSSSWPFVDVVFYKGKVYAATYFDLCCCWDIVGSSLGRQRNFYRKTNKELEDVARNLVEWRGELVMLMVRGGPWSELDYHSVNQVQLYKLSLQDYKCSLSYVRSLGDDALFVGANHSYAVSTCGLVNVQPNCIYFTEDVWNPICNPKNFRSNFSFGVFDLGKETCTTTKYSNKHAPIWFWPC